MFKFHSFTGGSLKTMLDEMNKWYLEKQSRALTTEFEIDNIWMSTALNGTEVLVHYWEK